MEIEGSGVIIGRILSRGALKLSSLSISSRYRSAYGAVARAGIAFALLAVLVTVRTQAAAEQKSPQSPTAAYKNQSSIDTSLAEDAAIYKDGCDAAHKREDAEYCQQRRSADAAIDQAKWAFWQLLIGAIGIGVLVLTVIYTARAAIAAQKSASAAEKAIEGGDAMLRHAERASERELRAYVFLDTADLLDGSLAKPIAKSLVNVPGVHLTVKNSGKTPAYHVVSTAEIAVIDIHNEASLVVSGPLPKHSANTMPPSGINRKWRRLGRKITNAESAGIKAGTHGVFIFGRIEYVDAFRKERFTNFRMVVTGQWPPVAGTTFTFCNAGNETDDDI